MYLPVFASVTDSINFEFLPSLATLDSLYALRYVAGSLSVDTLPSLRSVAGALCGSRTFGNSVIFRGNLTSLCYAAVGNNIRVSSADVDTGGVTVWDTSANCTAGGSAAYCDVRVFVLISWAFGRALRVRTN